MAPIPELDDVATDRVDRLVELRVGLANASHQLGVVCPVGETTDARLQVAERADDPVVEFARDPRRSAPTSIPCSADRSSKSSIALAACAANVKRG